MQLPGDLTFSDIGGALQDLGGAAGDLLSVGANKAKAKIFENAEALAEQNAKSEFYLTQIASTQEARKVTMGLGAAQAAVGGSGLTMGGSASDIIRSSIQQGSLAHAKIELEGHMQQNAYMQQADSLRAEADAAKSAASGGLFGGILKGLGAVAGIAMKVL